jgi:hypothetical protein
VTTRAKYRQTLAVLEVELATAPVTGAAIGGVLAQRCRDAARATWNRHLATVRSFARYCQRDGLLDIDGDIVLDRRAEKHDQTRSIPLSSLERPWERRDVALRERTLGAAAVRDGGTRRRGAAPERRGSPRRRQARPHAIEGRRHGLAVLRVRDRFCLWSGPALASA